MSKPRGEAWTIAHAKAIADAFAEDGIEFPRSAVPLVPYMDVVLWAARQQRRVDVETIATRWNVCRATAYRWHEKLFGGLEQVGQRSVKGPRRGALRRQAEAAASAEASAR